MCLFELLYEHGVAIDRSNFGVVCSPLDPCKLPRGHIDEISSTWLCANQIGGGYRVDGLGFRWLFWLPMIMAFAAAAAAFWVIPESDHTAPGRINVSAAVLLSGWLVALLVAVSQAIPGAGRRVGCSVCCG
jgi:hypothetical protein